MLRKSRSVSSLQHIEQGDKEDCEENAEIASVVTEYEKNDR